MTAAESRRKFLDAIQSVGSDRKWNPVSILRLFLERGWKEEDALIGKNSASIWSFYPVIKA